MLSDGGEVGACHSGGTGWLWKAGMGGIMSKGPSGTRLMTVWKLVQGVEATGPMMSCQNKLQKPFKIPLLKSAQIRKKRYLCVQPRLSITCYNLDSIFSFSSLSLVTIWGCISIYQHLLSTTLSLWKTHRKARVGRSKRDFWDLYAWRKLVMNQ